MTTKFSANIMHATAVETAQITALEERLAGAEEARVAAELETQVAIAQAAKATAEHAEMNRMCARLMEELRTVRKEARHQVELSRTIAAKMLEARKLEVAATRELLGHLAATTQQHDSRQRQLIVNAYKSMGASDDAAKVVRGRLTETRV